MPNIVDEINKFNVFGSKLGLERMEELLKRTGNPEKRFKALHVAGTNGKGSVCAFLYEILRAAGYSVGMFISPYLEEFNERIQKDGSFITDEELESCGRKVIDAADAMVKEGLESPTEFEVITAIAFNYFAEMDVDFAVLEVGLGGRGDSTNAAKNVVASIISSISLDHMDRIGDTVEQIAWEKAGIIRDGIPVFTYIDKEEAQKLVAKEAYSHKSPFYDFSDSKIRELEIDTDGTRFSARIKNKDYGNISISMPGEHQCSNAMVTIGCIEILRQKGIIDVDENALSKGLKKALMPGRFEVCKSKKKGFESKYFVLDGAHNEEGMEMSLKTLDDVFYDANVLVITGVLADKDIEHMLPFLKDMGNEYICVDVPSTRTMEAEALAKALEGEGRVVSYYKETKEGFKQAMKRIEDFDVCICVGSLYLVGEIRRLIRDGNIFEI